MAQSTFIETPSNYLLTDPYAILCHSPAMLIASPQTKDTTHIGFYASCSLTSLLAMVSSNMALRYLPYPTQVVGKSAKPIPVMLLGVLIGNKQYGVQKYVCIFLIVFGVVLFMFKDGKRSTGEAESPFGLGEVLLLLSLSMDGLTGAIQDRMRAVSRPSAQQMMLAMNGWGLLIVGSALLGTGELFQFVAFASKYPSLFVNLSLLSLTGALGQLFIFMMVTSFGPLSCSVVTTSRKFFTVLCSVVLFGNHLSPRQWGGAVLVFVGLFADMLMGKKDKAPAKPVAAGKDKEPIDGAKEKLIK